MNLSAHSPTIHFFYLVFGVRLVLVKALDSPKFYSVALPLIFFSNVRYTLIYFVECQLSPSLISLSLLFTTHLSLLQQTPVQSSPSFHTCFNLVINRSLGFGSNILNFRNFLTRFRFTYYFLLSLLSLHINSLTHYTKGTFNSSFRFKVLVSLIF